MTYTGEIIENNLVKSSFTASANDLLRIAVESGVVKYYRNNQPVYTSLQTVPIASGNLVTPLLARGTIFHKNTSINNAIISNNGNNQQITWKTFDNQITVSNNSFTKSLGCDDCNYLYSARERTDGDLRVYDVSNPSQIVLVKSIKASDLQINAKTPHNPVVMGNKLYVAWYQAGLQVFDLSNPANPVRVGQYDTFAPTYLPLTSVAAEETVEPWDVICGFSRSENSFVAGYDGNWAVYPFLGEDKVLLGDLATGLYVVDVSNSVIPLKNRVSDFDGDGKTDFSVYTPA